MADYNEWTPQTVTNIICDGKIFQPKYVCDEMGNTSAGMPSPGMASTYGGPTNKCDFTSPKYEWQKSTDDTLKRINRVCAVQNDTAFVYDSKKTKSPENYDEAGRRKIKDIFGWKRDKDWVEKIPLPFRFQSFFGKTVKFYTNQWLLNSDAASNALVRWCNDKPLWNSESYKCVGVDEPQWKSSVALKDTYNQAAVDFECSQPGMDGYKKAFPVIECHVIETSEYGSSESVKYWSVPFNSKKQFSVSVHKQNNSDELPALLLMKGSPTAVIPRCDYVMHQGERILFTPELQLQYTDLMSTVRNDRNIAVAELEITPEMIGLKAGESTVAWEGFNCDSSFANFPLGTEASVLEERVAAKRAACAEAGSPVNEEELAGLLRQSQKLTFLGFVGLNAVVEGQNDIETRLKSLFIREPTKEEKERLAKQQKRIKKEQKRECCLFADTEDVDVDIDLDWVPDCCVL